MAPYRQLSPVINGSLLFFLVLTTRPGRGVLAASFVTDKPMSSILTGHQQTDSRRNSRARLIVSFATPSGALQMQRHRWSQKKKNVGGENKTTSALSYRHREAHEEQATVLTMESSSIGQQLEMGSQLQQSRDAPELASFSSWRDLFDTGATDVDMLHQLCKSQLTLLATTAVLAFVVQGGLGHSLADTIRWGANEASLTPIPMLPQVAIGVLAAIPMIFSGHFGVETSNHPSAHHVQFATSHAVMTLFGRRTAQQPAAQSNENTTSAHIMLVCSLVLTAVTAFSEECVFRGFVPATLQHIISPQALLLPWIGQALLFGMGHLHPNSSKQENQLVVGMQTMHGLWLGLVYLLAQGSLLPGIIAHMLYDLHVFVETWHRVNGQMDWALQQRHTVSDDQLLDQVKTKFKVPKETLNVLESFFLAFDRQHKSSLSLPDVQLAVSYAFLQESKQPSTQQVEALFRDISSGQQQGNTDQDRINLASFCQLLLQLRKQQTATTT